MCMQPNFLLTGQVYPMLMSSVPQAWGAFDRKVPLFKLLLKCFLKSVVFIFCVYKVALFYDNF